jgi:hypothetical protein
MNIILETALTVFGGFPVDYGDDYGDDYGYYP